MQKILILSFSQTGQLDAIIDNLIKPFAEYNIERKMIEPLNPFPFPWDSKSFFDIMPETVLEIPIEIKPIHFKQKKYDLIILGYQPWFLSPSMPITALFNNTEFCLLLNNTPIITIIGARNMWLNAQERIKHMISDNNGQLIANIPFVDKTTNLISALTISHWMFSGKKEKKWNILPLPGVSENDINTAHLFGEIINDALLCSEYKNLQKDILKLNLIKINTNLLFVELKAKKIFRLWARKIKKHKKNSKSRRLLIKLFKYYLFIALFMVSPLLLLFYRIFIVPFSLTKIQEKKDYFCSINLK